MSHFEDDFGSVVNKKINSPKVCHFIYEYLSLIYENSEQCYNLLSTKDP
jgi:hypothetical protein